MMIKGTVELLMQNWVIDVNNITFYEFINVHLSSIFVNVVIIAFKRNKDILQTFSKLDGYALATYTFYHNRNRSFTILESPMKGNERNYTEPPRTNTTEKETITSRSQSRFYDDSITYVNLYNERVNKFNKKR